MRTTITHGIVYTGEEVIAPATVVVDGSSIVRVERTDAAKSSPATTATGLRDDDTRDGVIIDAAGRLVTPGLVNAHTHAYAALARGVDLKDPAPTNFVQILERIWWRLDRALTLDDIELSARFHGLECLRSGVTTVFDHHASQCAIRGSLAALARGFSALGLRSCMCYEVSDREGPEAAAEGIAENVTFISATTSQADDKVRARFGLHASLTLSDATLQACAEATGAQAAGFHIHVAEDRADREDALRRNATGVVARLERFGILGPRTICVHGVHLDNDEITTLAASQSWLAHCPQSNMNNAVGAAALAPLRSAGVRLALGTDGFTTNLAREALAAHLLQNHLHSDPGAGHRLVPALPFAANATLASEAFGMDTGRLRPGNPADLVVWGYLPPTPITADNLWGHLLFGLVDARAEEVLIAGDHVLRGGRATSCDEDQLTHDCSRAAARLWERL
jgi:putative selenium metabolism protein SsnA